MALYSYSITNEIKTIVPSSGSSITTTEAGKPSNAILVLDVTLPVGTYDLGAKLAEIKYPLWLFIKFSDVSGFKVMMDGAFASDDKFSSLGLKFAPTLVPAPPVIKLVTTVESRLRVFCVGNPII